MSAAAVVSYGRSHAHTTSSSPTPTPSSSTPSPPSTPTLMSLITRAASAPRALVATTNTEQKQQGQLSPSILRTTSRIATLVRTSYGLSSDEIGDRLSGHACITERDKRDAANNGHSLLFGEVLPLGVVKLCDAQHLNVAQATTVYDLGSGCGKLAMQVFLQYPHLRAVVGCELTASRASRASTAMQRLVKSRKHARVTQHEGVTRFIEPEKTQYRTLELRHQDLFACTDAWHADVVILETDLPSPQHLRLCNFLSQCKPGARVMTYLNIARIYETCRLRCPFVQMSSNGEHDRIHTSWAPNNGHRFFFWTKQHTIWTITVEHPISQHIVTQNKENLSQVSTATATATTLIPSRWESSTKKSNLSMSSSPTSSTSSSPSSPLLHVRHPSSSVDPSFIIHHDITSYPTTTRQFNISSACTVQQCLDAIMSKDASSYQLELVTDDEHHHTGVALHHATPVIRHLSLTHHPDQLTFVIRPCAQ